MKTSFGRIFYTAALILLLALTMLGTSFQQLVKNYLTETTFSRLDKNAQVISHLAASYAAGEDTSSQDFLLNLDVAANLSDTDIIICNSQGKVILCSDSPFGCKHLKLQVNSEYMDKVISSGSDRGTGMIRGLYDDSRFFIALPISDELQEDALGIVIVSVSTDDTNAVLKQLSTVYMNTAMVVVLVVVLLRHKSASPKVNSRIPVDLVNPKERDQHVMPMGRHVTSHRIEKSSGSSSGGGFSGGMGTSGGGHSTSGGGGHF